MKTPLSGKRASSCAVSSNGVVDSREWGDGVRRMSRRRFILTGFVLFGSVVLTWGRGRALGAFPYPHTLETLQYGRDREMAAYYQYVAFARKANAEGFHGIAYLFTAFSAAEFIHAQNFNKILVRLGVEVEPLTKPEVLVASTKENLLKAAAGERDSVDSFYPEVLRRLEGEKVPDAIAFTSYAWESEKQHREIMAKILRWAPGYFERVSKKIDEESGQYFVCQFCGSTVNKVPSDLCLICHLPSDTYRKIEAPY